MIEFQEAPQPTKTAQAPGESRAEPSPAMSYITRFLAECFWDIIGLIKFLTVLNWDLFFWFAMRLLLPVGTGKERIRVDYG